MSDKKEKKFNPPPSFAKPEPDELSEKENKRLSERFIKSAGSQDVIKADDEEGERKAVMVRMPLHHYNDLVEISEFMGIKALGALCLTLLLPSIRSKIEEIRKLKGQQE